MEWLVPIMFLPKEDPVLKRLLLVKKKKKGNGIGQ
jgi:hypothetical protein